MWSFLSFFFLDSKIKLEQNPKQYIFKIKKKGVFEGSSTRRLKSKVPKGGECWSKSSRSGLGFGVWGVVSSKSEKKRKSSKQSSFVVQIIGGGGREGTQRKRSLVSLALVSVFFLSSRVGEKDGRRRRRRRRSRFFSSGRQNSFGNHRLGFR